MLNDTTKPAEVLHKGGFDLLTLLHRRDVELQAHVTFGTAMTISNVASISTMGLSRARRHRDFLFDAGPHDQ